MNRQKLILCLLLIALVGAVIYAFVRSPRQQVASPATRQGAASAPRRAAPAARPAAGARTAAVAPSGVHIALLEQERPRFSGYRRNIFSPIFKEEVKLPPFKPVPLPLPPKPVAVPPPPVAAAAVPPPPPPPPTEEDLMAKEMAKFTFLGFLKKDGTKTVFLSKDNEIFLAKKGSILAQKFEVAEITDDAITIKSRTGGKELVMPLVEHRTLARRPGTSTRHP